MASILNGNIALIICCCIYLVWWSIAFNPMRSFPMGLKVALFLPTLIAGIAGIVLLVSGIIELPRTNLGIHDAVIVFVGALVYVLLAFLSSKLMGRQVTTELLLIIGWAVLEFCAVNSLYSSGLITFDPVIGALVVILVAVITSLACYLAYYRLEAKKAFYLGMAPLVIFAVAMAVLNLIYW